MKTMTCRQLGGACDQEFSADTFGEITEMSYEHGVAMLESGDEDHIRAMDEMKKLANDPVAMRNWIKARQKEFNALPED